MSRVFRPDGKVLIVAMDHGTNSGAPKGLEFPAQTISKIKKGGADAVIANYGLVKTFAEELSGLGVILRLDIPPTMLGKGHDSALVYGVEEALRLGADAVIANAGPGVGVEERTLPQLAACASLCDQWGMPLVGEMVPGGFDSDPGIRTLENIKLGARIASELGADFIKTVFQPGFREVVEASYVPVVVLGGSKTNDDGAFLTSIREAIDSGAAGVAIGRNVWGHENPEGMTRALVSIIHENASVEEALAYLG